MSVTRLLVKKVLEHAPVSEWSLQGFGMFRLYLSPDVRLHVWDSRFAVKDVTTIHTHPWHFTSQIIAGCIIDRLYEQIVWEDDDPIGPSCDPTHMRQRIVCGPGGGKCDDPPTPVALKLLQEVRIFPQGLTHIYPHESPLGGDNRYGMSAEAAHETRYHDGTITIIEREPLLDTERAYVFVPKGQEWVSAEPRPATVHEVVEMRRKALKMLEAAS